MPVDSAPHRSSEIAARLLQWYDRHARALPWRSPPGAVSPDPYRVWLSEVMLQQTTVATVVPYFTAFVARWPSVATLAAADEADIMTAWAGLGYYSRARNLVACARILAERGDFPTCEAQWRALPGVGAYTAAAIAAIAFGQRAVVVDGNVERVVARLFAVATPLPAARPALRLLTDTITPSLRCGDFAQAMMDLGATICTPRAPRCSVCPIAEACQARAEDRAASYPRRLPKLAKPERRATAWWIVRDGQVRLVRRPPQGLLGGMRALPSTLDAGSADEHGDLRGQVVHTFTHFRLTLDIRIPLATAPLPDGEWCDIAALDAAGLPTLFAKAVAVARAGEGT